MSYNENSKPTISELRATLKKKGLSIVGDYATLAGRLQRRIEVENSIEKFIHKEKHTESIELEYEEDEVAEEAEDVEVAEEAEEDEVAEEAEEDEEELHSESEEEIQSEPEEVEEEVQPETEEIVLEIPEDFPQHLEVQAAEKKGRWAVIHSTLPATLYCGIYSTKRRAQTAYIKFLLEQSGNLQTMFYKTIKEIVKEYPEIGDEFDRVLGKAAYPPGYMPADAAKIAKILYSNAEVEDMFCDIISHQIFDISDELMFDFREFLEWDYEGLYRLQNDIRERSFSSDDEEIGEEIKEIENENPPRRCVSSKPRVLIVFREPGDEGSDSEDSPVAKRTSSMLDKPLDECGGATMLEGSEIDNPGDSLPYPVMTKEDLDLDLEQYFSGHAQAMKESTTLVPQIAYDQGMTLVDFMMAVGNPTGHIGYEDKKVIFWLDSRVSLDAEISKKHKIVFEGAVLEFRYYNRFPVGNTWFVTASK